MNEISIQLAEVNPTVFYGGSKSKNIAILKRYFPKLKIVARGDIVTAYGEEEVLEEFEKQMDRLMMHYGNTTHSMNRLLRRFLTSHPKITLVWMKQIFKPFCMVLVVKLSGTHRKSSKISRVIATNDLVFAVGPAGTGKTYTGVAMAVKALKNKEVKRIVLRVQP